MATAMGRGSQYEIIKIWVPTHGVINVYRKPTARGGEYHVDNGCLLEAPGVDRKIENLRILASHGSVIKIKRDGTLPNDQDKYTIDPPNLAMEVTAVSVDSW